VTTAVSAMIAAAATTTTAASLVMTAPSAETGTSAGRRSCHPPPGSGVLIWNTLNAPGLPSNQPKYSFHPEPSSYYLPVDSGLSPVASSQSPVASSHSPVDSKYYPADSKHSDVDSKSVAGADDTNTYLRRPFRQESIEDALVTLRAYDTTIIVDDSGSMWNRWGEAKRALSTLASYVTDYDTDGISIHFINSSTTGHNMRDAEAVEKLFRTVQPGGATPLGGKLEELLLIYLEKIETEKNRDSKRPKDRSKPVGYIVITDGVPTDDPASVIAAAAARLDKGNFPLTQVGIQFVQIGSIRSATEYLKTLDDDLQNTRGVRDIVDCTPYTGGPITGDLLTKILLGGINRRVDRHGGGSVRY